jgi:hypothetical protein
MPARYENFGVEFMYPDNWSVTDECLDAWPRTVSIQSPNGAYWELQVYPTRVNPTDLCREVLQAMEQEYDSIESETITEEVFGLTMVGYNLCFFCLDFLVTSRVRGFYRGPRTYLLTCQAESREFEKQELIFQAMTKTLLCPETP